MVVKIPGANPRDPGMRGPASARRRADTGARSGADAALIDHRARQGTGARSSTDTALIDHNGWIKCWLHGIIPFILN